MGVYKTFPFLPYLPVRESRKFRRIGILKKTGRNASGKRHSISRPESCQESINLFQYTKRLSIPGTANLFAFPFIMYGHLFAKVEFLQDSPVSFDIAIFQIIQKTTTLTD